MYYLREFLTTKKGANEPKIYNYIKSLKTKFLDPIKDKKSTAYKNIEKRITNIENLFKKLGLVDGIEEVLKKLMSNSEIKKLSGEITIAELEMKINNNLKEIEQSLRYELQRQTEVYKQAAQTLKYYSNYKNLPETDKITTHKQKLDKISNAITMKDRLIQINEEQYRLNERRLKALRRVYIPITLAIIAYVLFSIKFKATGGMAAATTVFLMYIVYLMYEFNALNIQNILSPEVEKVQEVLAEVEDDLDDDYEIIRRKIAEYTNANCVCPEKKKDKGDAMDDNNLPTEKMRMEDNGNNYYYDGTAPVQKYNKDGSLSNKGIDWE